VILGLLNIYSIHFGNLLALTLSVAAVYLGLMII